MSIYSKESPKYLDECLHSLFIQTLLPSEIVIVKDGPLTDCLEKVLDKWHSLLPIKIVSLPENKGLGYALSVGLVECSNDIIARMDADDICLPRRIEVQVRYLEKHQNIDILGAYAYSISEQGKVTSVMKVPTTNNKIKMRVWSCPFIHPTVMFNKKSILNIGNYDFNSAHRQEDYELWIRAANNRLFFSNIDMPLIKYRVSSNYYIKNDFNVAFNRLKIGLPAAWKHDRSILSILAVFFPLFRCAVPSFFRMRLDRYIRKLTLNRD